LVVRGNFFCFTILGGAVELPVGGIVVVVVAVVVVVGLELEFVGMFVVAVVVVVVVVVGGGGVVCAMTVLGVGGSCFAVIVFFTGGFGLVVVPVTVTVGPFLVVAAAVVVAAAAAAGASVVDAAVSFSAVGAFLSRSIGVFGSAAAATLLLLRVERPAPLRLGKSADPALVIMERERELEEGKKNKMDSFVLYLCRRNANAHSQQVQMLFVWLLS